MKKTIEEKREFVHRHLLAMAKARRDEAALMIAKARKASTLAAFYETRSAPSVIEGFDELTLDMMIEDWTASLDVERWRQEALDAELATLDTAERFVSAVPQVRVTTPNEEGGVIWRAEISEVPKKDEAP